jgi:hypothetical protein
MDRWFEEANAFEFRRKGRRQLKIELRVFEFVRRRGKLSRS